MSDISDWEEYPEPVPTGPCHFSRLPPELVQEIFLHYYSPETGASTYPRRPLLSPYPFVPPMQLCRVSSQWRHVALATPRLWSSIYVQGSSAEWCFEQELLSQWLALTRGVPLSFHLESITNEGNKPLHTASAEYFDKQTAENFAQLLEHIQRWEYVSINFDWKLAAQYLDKIITDPSASQLKSVELGFGCYSDEYIDDIFQSLGRFRGLHQLKVSVQKHWSRNSNQAYLLTFPWAQLTHVELDDEIAKDDLLSILAQCMRAVEFKLRTVVPSTSLSGIPTPTLQLPNLRSLTLESKLGLDGLLDAIPWSGLTQLNLKSFPISMDDCAALLFECSKVEDLALALTSPHLTVPLNMDILLPNLVSLALRCPSEMGRVLKHLTIPTLRNLYYHNNSPKSSTWARRDPNPGWEEFEAFCARSSCQLEKLDFTEVDANLKGFIRCMKISNLQTLRELRIVSEDVSNELVASTISRTNLTKVELFNQTDTSDTFYKWSAVREEL